MTKKKFIQPQVIQHLEVQSERPILSVSLVNDLTVRSTGQEVQEYNFGENNEKNFNFTWE